ncbi:hypothetical protein C5D09_14125 [Rathayibacter sp. AY1C9]|uniref:hypothetical protein n=1 Tax=Rathayibacter sp. AY1C9 TaxID=2080541 RepID=UPI000CE8F28B|nr:hypothetical protein [Rathayibacter sp. AY1C9]PPH44159.1 hypothetical protein C5D09_14125 [Rathayibacter sp. AY1C9]
MEDDTPGVQDANDRQRAALYDAMEEVARLRSEDLPGIGEIFRDNVIVNTARRDRGRLGSFAPESWDFEGAPISEVVVHARHASARPGQTLGEDVLVTLLHELAHMHAHYTGVKDTSNRGRWHNRRFGEIAVALGLVVERPADYRGHTTPRLSSRYAEDYAVLIAALDDALRVRPSAPVLARPGEPSDHPASGQEDPRDVPPAARGKYVFLSCSCELDGGMRRTIRVARGSFVENAVQCLLCQTPYQPSESLTGAG